MCGVFGAIGLIIKTKASSIYCIRCLRLSSLRGIAGIGDGYIFLQLACASGFDIIIAVITLDITTICMDFIVQLVSLFLKKFVSENWVRVRPLFPHMIDLLFWSPIENRNHLQLVDVHGFKKCFQFQVGPNSFPELREAGIEGKNWWSDMKWYHGLNGNQNRKIIERRWSCVVRFGSSDSPRS